MKAPVFSRADFVPRGPGALCPGTHRSEERLAYLDGWRGVAIALVLLSHFASIHEPRLGRLGVDLFFVLSGLLMSRILFEQKTPLATFYRRRASRILPVFLLYVAVVFLVYAAAGTNFTMSEFVSTLTFTRTYVGESAYLSDYPLGHVWSLNVEEHSYVLLSAVAALPLLSRNKGWILIGIAACSAMAMAMYWLAGSDADYMIRTECAALPIMLSAGYRQIRAVFLPYVRPWMAPAAIALAIGCYTRFAGPVGPAAAPFLLAFAVNHIGSTDAARRLLEHGALRMLGIWSFSIYLWQQPFYRLVLAKTLPPISGLALAMIVGLLSYYAWESPIRRWLNEHWHVSRVVPRTPTAEMHSQPQED